MAQGKKRGSAELWVDGACKGNPGGHSGAGIILKLASGKIIQRSKYLGRMNSNEAEYCALLAGVQLVAEYPVNELKIRTDSELMHHQIMGLVRTRMDSLIQLQGQIYEVLDKLDDWTIQHVGREKNAGADVLANRAALSQKDRDQVFDPKAADKEQLDSLENYVNGSPDKLASQEVDIGTPWGSLGAWPENRPPSVMLMYDISQGGFYVVTSEGVKLLWLGSMALPPAPQATQG